MTARTRSIRHAFVGLSVTATLVLATSCGSGSGGGGGASSVSPPASTAASSSTATTTSASPTTSARPTATPYATTSVAHAAPWKDKNADFGWVSKAKPVSGGVQFSFDRATWLLP